MTTSASPSPVPAPSGVDATVQAVLARLAGEPGALLPILHALQDTLGHVPDAAVPRIADALNLSRAEVHGVISYYHHFKRAPGPAHTLQICRAEACQSMGAEALLAHARAHLGCGPRDTSGDGAFAVEAVYCLGLCACSPALAIDGQVHARVTPQKFDALVAQARSAA